MRRRCGRREEWCIGDDLSTLRRISWRLLKKLLPPTALRGNR